MVINTKIYYMSIFIIFSIIKQNARNNTCNDNQGWVFLILAEAFYVGINVKWEGKGKLIIR